MVLCVLFIRNGVFVLCLDYIAAARSQEDDIHNVQSVIDSLSLDYLQISLSHITGTMIYLRNKDTFSIRTYMCF